MMCPMIDNLTSWKICARNMSAAEIHCELCAVYSQNLTSEVTVRQLCRMFKYRQTNVCNEKRSGRPSVVMTKTFLKFQKFCVNFHKFHTLFCTGLS
jgi:hypothetical protein